MKGNTYRERIDLGGSWQFRVKNGCYTERRVPASYHCCGSSEYKRQFRLTLPQGKRAVLRTEGINYRGEIYLNGQLLGVTLPYCHDSFEITDLLREENELVILVEDITAPFGPTDGWCGYSGIIRAIYIEILPMVYLDDVWFRQFLNSDMTRADARVEISLNGADTRGYSARVRLERDGEAVASATGDRTVCFGVEHPALWSPASPALYSLKTELMRDGAVVDAVCSEVGFRSLTMDDKRFYLNGEPFFFAGLCRHDLGNDEEGQTLSDEALERDMRMIKDLGVNFVRLVHYPHDQRVIEWADRLGLFISEEAGLWWSDIRNKTLTDGALTVLKKTVLRDRSHPSVAFWMSFNECIFTHEVLCDSVRVCREYDPDRFVSGASCMTPEITREMFERAGIDFYTFHPYGYAPEKVTGGFLENGKSSPNGATLESTMRAFLGKPLIFSEWGGVHTVDNPALFSRFLMTLKAGRDQGILAGMFYWAFADMFEFNRTKPACVEGLQIEGLVTMDRQPKMNYYVYQKFLREWNEPSEQSLSGFEILREDTGRGADALPIALLYPDTEAQRQAWEAATEDSRVLRSPFTMRKKRLLTYGPQLPRAVEQIGDVRFEALLKPVAISERDPRYSVEVNAKGKRLVLLGNVLYALGVPIYGAYGEVCANMTLTYSDGTQVKLPLRNGIELLTVVTTYASTILDPMSPILEKAVRFSYDKSFENYRIYTMSVALDAEKTLARVDFESCMAERCLLLYGMSLVRE